MTFNSTCNKYAKNGKKKKYMVRTIEVHVFDSEDGILYIYIPYIKSTDKTGITQQCIIVININLYIWKINDFDIAWLHLCHLVNMVHSLYFNLLVSHRLF